MPLSPLLHAACRSAAPAHPVNPLELLKAQGGIARIVEPRPRAERSEAIRAELRPISRVSRTRTDEFIDGGAWIAARPVIDLVATVLAVIVTLNWPGEQRIATSTAWPLIVFPGLVLVLLHLRGMYARRLRPTVLEGVVPVAGAVSIATMAVVMLEVYVARSSLQPGVLAHVWGLGLGFLGIARVGTLAFQRLLRARGDGGRPTLIIGAGLVGARLAARLDRRPEFGLRPIGFLDGEPSQAAADDREQPVLGTPEDLEWIAHITGAEHVVIAFSTMRDEEGVDLVRRCEEAGLEVSLVPRLFESLTERATMEPVGGLPLVALRHTAPGDWRFAVKHAVDRLAAAVILLGLSPLLAMIAVAVKLTSPGPVLFSQRRVGHDGKEFAILKFRSMRTADHAAGGLPAGQGQRARRHRGVRPPHRDRPRCCGARRSTSCRSCSTCCVAR